MSVDQSDCLPNGLLLAYYGDDFTGSTDVLQVFCAAGIDTVLFLRSPSDTDLARFPNARVIGVAGNARAQSPAWMDAELPAIFKRLRALGAPILHYKICSTFDSSPTIGSIGRAIDLGTHIVGGDWSPMIVGAPKLKRYQAFGNLFAIANGAGHRLDRHPTMSRHPVTPMHEADLRRHLAAQTMRRIELIDLAELQAGIGDARRESLTGSDTPIVLIDIVDDATLRAAGALVWASRATNPRGIFSASSSGLPAALVAHWRASGFIPALDSLPSASARDLVLVISGSCSPQTAAQIAWAQANGYACMRLDIRQTLSAAMRNAHLQSMIAQATDAIKAGQSPCIYSAMGPDDQAVLTFDEHARAAQLSRSEAAHRIGTALAEIARATLQSGDVRRLVVAGGDSSGAVMQALDAYALTIAGQLEPGAPLCRIASDNAQVDGLEVTLKGGQMGSPQFFEVARRGTALTPVAS